MIVRLSDGIGRTLVYYSSPEGHNHDDNCVKREAWCEDEHWMSLSLRNKCTTPDCNWVGEATCFCHPGKKLVEWPTLPTDIRDMKIVEKWGIGYVNTDDEGPYVIDMRDEADRLETPFLVYLQENYPNYFNSISAYRVEFKRNNTRCTACGTQMERYPSIKYDDVGMWYCPEDCPPKDILVDGIKED